MNTHLQSGEIESRLQAVRKRIRRVQKIRAVMMVLTVALGGLIATMAADYVFSPLPSAVRWGIFAAWLVLILIAAKFGFSPVLKSIGLLQVARWLEVRHPEMEERLSTVLEMTHGAGVVSEGLLASLARAAEADAGKVDVVREVLDARTSLRWGRPASALAAVMLLAFVLWPHQASRLFVRAVAPFSDVGNAGAGRFVVKPGNIEVLAGDPVRIEADYGGQEKDLELWMEFENGRKISQSMTKDGGIFRYLLDPAKSGFHYRIRAGRDESDSYTVTVWPLPELLEPRVALRFPEYTGLPPKESSLDQGIEAVAETRVNLTGLTNTAVESAWLEMAGKRLSEGMVEKSANGGRISFSWKLAAGESGEAVVMLKHRLGRTIESLRFPINVLEDQPPQIVLLSPMQKDLKVRQDEVLTLKYEVAEDFALAKLGVEVDVAGKDTILLDRALPARVGSSKPPVFRGEAAVSIGEMRARFSGIHEMRVRVKAEDGRPVESGGPGVGFSEWVNLRIDEGAESLARQELWQEHDGAKQTIEEAIRATREARERMDWHREEIKKGELNDNAQKDLKDADEKLAATDEKLRQLSSQMKESVHASKSDEVKEAADLVAKAREDLENSRLQDTPPERDSKTELARNETEAAVKKLENVRNAMDREREKIEDLARLQDLAQQQQEVARQAGENLARDPAAAEMPKDWQDSQKRTEEAIRQQLNQRPDAKAEALKAQAEQAKTLAEEAKQMAKAQENLEQQTKQNSENSLKESLLAEQAKIAEKVGKELSQARESRSPLADTLPEVTSAAEGAHDQLEKGENQKAADTAQRAGQLMTEAAAKSADKGESDGKSLARKAQAESLNQLAERQKQVADAMASLAKGDIDSALKGLQAAQAEAANDLAQDMGNMPQVDGNSSMNQAKNSGRQGSERAKSAAEQGQKNLQLEASKQHGQSSQNFEKSAESLARAAEEFSKQAQQAATQQANPQRTQASPGEMAEAFQQAAQAAGNPQAAQAAVQAANAAQALAQAARVARQQMQGKPGPQGQPGSTPAQNPQNGPPTPQADPGVPPELAKLGISSADWERIQASLKSDVGAGEGGAVPEEYRELVKGYFESISKKSSKD